MSCLYCGKELGPLQLLRSEEYCCVAHRKLYQERLGRALHRIADDGPRATRIADFNPDWPLQIGFFKQIVDVEFQHRAQFTEWPAVFSLEIAPVLGTSAASLREPVAATLANAPAPADYHRAGVSSAALPRFALAAVADPSEAGVVEVNPPALCGTCLPVPAPEPVMRDVEHRGDPVWQWPQAAVIYPAGAALATTPSLPRAEQFAAPPAPQPAEILMRSAACAGPIEVAIAVQLPISLRRTLETAVAPLASLAAEPGASGMDAAAAPAACLQSISAAGLPQEPVLLPQRMPAVGKNALPLAGIAAESGAASGVDAAAALAASLQSISAARQPNEPVLLPQRMPAVRENALPLAGITAESGAASSADATAAPAASWQSISTTRRSQEPVLLPQRMPAVGKNALPLGGVAAGPGAGAAEQPMSPAASLDGVETPEGHALSSVRLPERGLEVELPAVAGGAPCDYAAMPVESLPQTAFAAQPVIARLSLFYPAFNLEAQGMNASVVEAGEAQQPAAAAPGHSGPVELPLAWMPGIELASPQASFTVSLETAVPQAGPVALEFYCRRVHSVAAAPLSWMMPVSRLRRPRMTLAAVLPPLEQPAQAPRKKASLKVTPMPARRSSSLLREIAKPLAACFLVGAFVWLGATAMRVGTHTAAVNRDVASLIQAETELTVGAQDNASRSGKTGSGRNAGQATPAGAEEAGLVSRVRQAIASRAASQLTENFHEGMAAWSAGAKASPSWARNAEGFIRPAAFGLFRPSENYKDYRVEFFGQIEQKSMSWAVRASDPRNYYGMKVTVVEPGLRPVVAIEHYPVVDGKKGRNTRVPLPELMFHNNTPYHVEVAVRGNRVTTSIEGQEVDSWLDDALPKKGGVGFFADAGERARVYWLKVAKNEDFLGRICAYLSGSTDTTSSTADLQPGRPSVPASSTPIESADVALAVFAFRRNQDRRRSATWSL